MKVNTNRRIVQWERNGGDVLAVSVMWDYRDDLIRFLAIILSDIVAGILQKATAAAITFVPEPPAQTHTITHAAVYYLFCLSVLSYPKTSTLNPLPERETYQSRTIS